MSFIESVKGALPDYAKDTKLNLDAVLLRSTLDADVAMGCAVAALAASEDDIITHVNADHPQTLALLGGSDAGWRMVALDCDGFDMAAGGLLQRHAFASPVADADGVRRALILAARAARAQ